MRSGEVLLGAAIFAWLGAGAGWAADEPSPRVGRLSVVAGAVQYRAPAGEWADALINEPIAAGAGLRTGAGAEAGWRGAGARVALAPASEVRVLRLDGDTLQIALASGRIGIHLAAGSASPKTVEIDLPRGGVWLAAPGDYDVTAGDAPAAAQIDVFAGKARVGGGLDDDRVVAAPAPDWFSDWWRSQDDSADLRDPRPWPEVAGIAALGEAGRWERDPTFGNVWYPSDVAADWSPYRDGAWRFLPPWGWTWIPAESWGFAPSHYGRWARIDDRWGWVPGNLASTDYSPAQVAFLGTAGIGLSRPGDIGANPAVAWFPLAPGEKIGAGADADGRYENRRFATAVPRTVFAAGLPVAPALVDDVPARRFADAPVILHALGIPPAGPAVPAAAAKPMTARIARPVAPAAAAPPPNDDAATEERRVFVVALHDPPPPLRPAARARVREAHRRPHVAAAVVSRPHIAVAVASRPHVAAAVASRPRPLAGTPHSPHNRQHLAAARGGA